MLPGKAKNWSLIYEINLVFSFFSGQFLVGEKLEAIYTFIQIMQINYVFGMFTCNEMFILLYYLNQASRTFRTHLASSLNTKLLCLCMIFNNPGKTIINQITWLLNRNSSFFGRRCDNFLAWQITSSFSGFFMLHCISRMSCLTGCFFCLPKKEI